MPKKVSDSEKENILNLFQNGNSIKYLAIKFGYSIPTITRHLKSFLNKDEFKVNKKLTLEKSKFKDKISKGNNSKLSDPEKEIFVDKNFSQNQNEDDDNSKDLSHQGTFLEIAPLNYEIDISNQKDLSSEPLESVELPKIAYLIVKSNIELETKLLKDFPEWQFLPEDDLNRTTIEIHVDLKIAKRKCNKDQKVIKVPNTNVLKIVAPILLARGISRIVSDKNLISL